jgi:replicative DNA helicase
MTEAVAARIATGRSGRAPSSASRLPPIDAPAEAAVLSELLLKNEAFDEVSFLRPDHFYSAQNRRVMEAIVALQERGDACDLTGVATWLNNHNHLNEAGGTVYLAELADATPSFGHIEQHARTVVEKWRLRRLIETCQRSAAEAYGGTDDAQGLIEGVEASIAEIAHLEQRVTYELAAQIMARHLRSLEHNRDRRGEVVGVPSGYVDLDKRTGGMSPGDLIIIAGRPGMGKTGFATNLALNITEPPTLDQVDAPPPLGVAFFSLEMPREQIASRMACTLQKIDNSKLRQNTLDAGDWSKLYQAVVDMERRPLWVDDEPAISVLELRSRVRKLKREIENGRCKVECSGLGLVVVDYLQLMTGRRERGDSREREVSSLSQDLKKLAKELQVPVVALSQLNRSVEKNGKKDKRPGLSDLRESGAIEQDADMVLFLYRPRYYDKSASRTDAELIVAKQRNGPTGTIGLGYQGNYLRFYSADLSYSSDDDEQFGDHFQDLDDWGDDD